MGAHWNDGDGQQAKMTFVDNTGAPWPIYAAANTWDNAGRIVVAYNANNCNGDPHCVGVNATNMGGDSCNANPGYFAWNANSSRHLLAAQSYIRLNQDCNPRSTRVQRFIACHEEGHATGLDDEPQSIRDQTCMAAGTAPPHPDFDTWEETPRPHDFEMLDNQIYTHND
ncbi:hypothetical protein HJD18_14165 [Thermoleophilia bacterium SCSIO 60948]|nr:hypothetical protein HJD18_14165 [Thermoleophilia bacterium SCSIO 60948]